MLCVLLSHSGYRTIFGMRYGIVAVESFFVVSGFLIGGILLRDFKDEMNGKIMWNFWKKRWFRTLPLYYAVLLLKFALVDSEIGANLGWYFVFLQNNIYGVDFLPVSWTLVVEEWFYLLIPFFFIIFFRNGITPKKFYLLIILFVIGANLARMAWILYTDRGFGAMIGNFVFRLDSNLIGVGLAGLLMFHKEKFQRMAKADFVIPAAIGLILLSALFGYYQGGCTEPCVQHFWLRTVWFSAVSIGIALILPFFYCAPIFAPRKDGTESRFRYLITWGSLLAYPVYLVHSEIYIWMKANVDGWKDQNELLVFVVNNLIVVTVGLLLYHLIDKPVLRMRKRFVK